MYSKLTVSFLLSSLLSISNAAVHEIDVGEDGLRFSPERVDNVSQGDVLIFKLYPEHTVIQSNFGSPCTPAEGGFYSGPFSGTDNGKKVFVVNVTGEGPWYWYCGVDRHCQNGMVGGRNLPSQGETLDAYKNKAKNVQNSESPSQLSGGVLVEEGQISSLTASAASTATVTAT
ncbi:uncharacterized protein EI97DRAFT_379653 [Westerdykella ornata]|uniref:Cupredoxin n=1 Tax=Westerdykella ornata TaxID=318751 RepID=A0A6A6JFX2_WESOR|nr:uncharacterized protein EI97DRAFT_379653 [Westerdykella ornata]KAF2275227.1 hypothetical protein EI97DRAFT_379653 [Westerdykella ornata]